MSSFVFQEIREFRSFAYSFWARYFAPWKNGEEGMFWGYVGCQADKTMEAISVFKDITLNMPLKPERLEQTKSGLIKGINSKRPNFRQFPNSVSAWQFQGYTDDPRKAEVKYYESMSFDDIANFQKQHLSDKPMTITILTDQERINMDELAKFGEIIILDKKDILN
jgi:Predicted Zn-dependent peptidases